MTTTLRDADGNPPTIRRSETFRFTFAVKDANGAAKSLSGVTEVTFAIASTRSAAATDLVLTLGNGVTHDNAGGNITVEGTPQQTEALPVGDRWCELWVTDAAGDRKVVGEGTCRVYDTLVAVEEA